jgi:hypothetical protein
VLDIHVIALVQAARIDGEVSFLLLTLGLATTIPLVVFGAALLTSLLDRFPVLIYAGAGRGVHLRSGDTLHGKVFGAYLRVFTRFQEHSLRVCERGAQGGRPFSRGSLKSAVGAYCT